tara:strand:+ start:8295 stop:8510 length:216 start_codon:yes stop_codon:yes gene_type:complete
MKVYIAKDLSKTITRYIVTVWFNEKPTLTTAGHWQPENYRNMRNHLSDDKTGANLEPGELWEYDATHSSPK